MEPSFRVGDKSVYPTHGVADVVAVERKTVGGNDLSFYHLRVMGSGLKIIVPVHKAAENGMRPVADEAEVDELFELLRDHEVPCDRQTWNRRHRGFMEKIRTGSLFEVGEVYRDLSLLKQTKQLSHSEKQMLRTARDLLVKELAVARAASEDQVAKELDSMFKN
ncbi:MAG: CarD family transcriptional regulator [Nannocystaceae bacterium]